MQNRLCAFEDMQCIHTHSHSLSLSLSWLAIKLRDFYACLCCVHEQNIWDLFCLVQLLPKYYWSMLVCVCSFVRALRMFVDGQFSVSAEGVSLLFLRKVIIFMACQGWPMNSIIWLFRRIDLAKCLCLHRVLVHRIFQGVFSLRLWNKQKYINK